jgi:hypothetical protein
VEGKRLGATPALPAYLVVTLVWLGAFWTGVGLGWLVAVNRMAWRDAREERWISEN